MEAEVHKCAARVLVSVRRNTVCVSDDGTDQLQREELSQKGFYAEVVHPFVERCLQGCCGSLIAYGGWGSGKSYTLGTLDPQQLAPASSGDESAGVLPRCVRQLYDRLGPNAAVEITCVEVQGEDVADLLDPRVEAPAARLAPEPVFQGQGQGQGGATTSYAGAGAVAGASGASPLTPRGVGRSPRPQAPVARRKPLTLAVARSLPEALLTLKRAVSCRQAFVTATRHSSSRTHAIFQLRWRNPSTPPTTAVAGAPCLSGLASSAAGDAVPSLGSRSAAPTALFRGRPFSAPPRAGLTGVAAAAAGGAGSRKAGGGPVCTLTLVDTCSSCPLLPPKEGSAVKRSLLALGRVLNALQRRQALTLRESKLTRLLEGALDQVLLVACLGGSSDEAALQLVKLLQQGAPKEGMVQRRLRRASSSDSGARSAGWDTSSAHVAAGNARSSGRITPTPSIAGTAALTAAPPNGNSSDVTPAETAHIVGSSARRASFPATRASLPVGAITGGTPRVAPVTAPAVGRRAAPGTAAASPAGGLQARMRQRPAPVDISQSGLAVGHEAQSGAAIGGTGGGAATPPAGAARSAPPPLSIPRSPDPLAASPGPSTCPSPGAVPSAGSGSSAPGPGGPHPAAGLSPTTSGPAQLGRSRSSASSAAFGLGSIGQGAAHGGAGEERRSGDGAGLQSRTSACGSVGSATGTSSGSLGATASPRQKPPAVSARAAPGPDVRRSQGFSVLAGKWAPPPPLSPKKVEKSFPVLPVLVTSAARGSATAAAARGPEPGSAPASVPSSFGSTRPALTTPQQASPQGTGKPVASPHGSTTVSPAITPSACAGAPECGSSETPSPYARISQTPPHSTRSATAAAATTTATAMPPLASAVAAAAAAVPSAVTASTTAPGTAANACNSPASGSLSQRRRSGIPTPPPPSSSSRCQASPSTSPFLSLALATAAATSATSTATTASSSSPLLRVRSPFPPSPAGSVPAATSPLVSLVSAVHPTPRASMRYSSANQSRDGAAAGVAAPARTRLGGGAAAADPAASGGAGGGGVAAACSARCRTPDPCVGAKATACSSVAGGAQARWASPMLRLRRAEWLADGRRTRSALHRPRPVAALTAEARGSPARAASAKTPRECAAAPLSRVTLSAQYKDLVHHFQAFQDSFRHRTPIHQRSSGAVGASAEAATQPQGQRHGAATHAQPAPGHAAALPRAGACPSPAPLPHPAASARALGACHGSLPPPACDAWEHSTPSPGRPTHRTSGLSQSHLRGHHPHNGEDTSPRHHLSNLGRTQSAAPSAAVFTAALAGGAAAAPTAAPQLTRHRSPAPEDGLLSLTAAAAAAAAAAGSRAPAPAGGLPPSRQRPGVSRSSATPPSPCRPSRRSSPFSESCASAVVLELNLLPSATAIGNNPSPRQRDSLAGRGMPREACGDTATGPGRLQPTAAAVAAATVAAAGVPQPQPAAEDECVRSLPSVDSGLSNMLGPRDLADLHLMLTAGGAGALAGARVRASRAEAGAASVSPHTPTGAAPVAAATGEEIAGSASPPGPSGHGEGRGADDELPAFSCFVIPAHALAQPGPVDAPRMPKDRASGGSSSAKGEVLPKAAGAAVAGYQSPLPQPQPQSQRPAAALPSPERRPRLALPEASASPTRPESPGTARDIIEPRLGPPSSQQQQHQERGRAKQSLQLSQLERVSAESGVLRGSCTPSCADDMSPRAPAPGMLQQQQSHQQPQGTDPQEQHRHRLARCGETNSGCGGIGAAAAAAALATAPSGNAQEPRQAEQFHREPCNAVGAGRMVEAKKAFNDSPSAPCTSPTEEPPAPSCVPTSQTPPQHSLYDLDEQSVVIGESDSDSDAAPANRQTRSHTAAAGDAGAAAHAHAADAAAPQAQLAADPRIRASVRERVAALEAALSPPNSQRGEWPRAQTPRGAGSGSEARPAAARSARAGPVWAGSGSGAGALNSRSSLAAAAAAVEVPGPEPSEEPELRDAPELERALDSSRALAPVPGRERAGVARAAAGAGAVGRTQSPAQRPLQQQQQQQPRRGVSPSYAAAAAAAAARAAAAQRSPSPSPRAFGFGFGFGAASRLRGDATATAVVVPKGQLSPAAGTGKSPLASPSPSPSPSPSGVFRKPNGEQRAAQASPRTAVASSVPAPAAPGPPPKGSYAAQAAQRQGAKGWVAAAASGGPVGRAATAAAAATKRRPGVGADPAPSARRYQELGGIRPAELSGDAAVAFVDSEDAEESEELALECVPPPPAYPAGFVSWAKRVFSGGALPKAAERG